MIHASQYYFHSMIFVPFHRPHPSSTSYLDVRRGISIHNVVHIYRCIENQNNGQTVYIPNKIFIYTVGTNILTFRISIKHRPCIALYGDDTRGQKCKDNDRIHLSYYYKNKIIFYPSFASHHTDYKTLYPNVLQSLM